ncbi:O-antigen ligase family protein [Desertivirga xinjiangensis]|uniref:O-antigen ligase family protein n=1 Tax=Desertivirga xinjiangensis TaxID=539206 RepID=UPI00210E8383|nr:O-antigen ligase family protein [Pedobacter xinjiangensis]
MLLNHVYTSQINQLRALLTGESVKILQSPSGISAFIFTFGYQIAALTSFGIVSVAVFRKNLLIQLLVFIFCVLLIFWGMSRSVLVVLALSVGTFWVLFYRIKTVIIFAALFSVVMLLSSSIQNLAGGRKQNIFAKNEKHVKENRSGLAVENLKIIADNPLGLTWTGKTWEQVARYNPTFKLGESGLVTSHNAYLMFITYLGIVPGLIFLLLFYQRIIRIFWLIAGQVRKPENALLVSLCFSLFAISLNSFFHNDWLLGGSGPTLFLYFGVLHLARLQGIR